MKGIEYRGLSRIEGPVVIAARSRNVGFNEVVAVYDREGGRKLGRSCAMDIKYDVAHFFLVSFSFLWYACRMEQE